MSARNLQIRIRPANSRLAFTLVELLVVMTVIALLYLCAAPAMQQFAKAGRFTKAIYGISDALREARAYAIAKNTYVFVGIAETDESFSPLAASQKTRAENSGGGRVTIFSAASNDGTRIYDPASEDIATSWQTAVREGRRLVAIGKLRSFDGARLTGQLPRVGGLSRPTVYSPDDRIGSMYRDAATPLNYPLESANDASRQQYTFTRVIEFDPRGCPHVVYSANADTLAQYLEIGLGEWVPNGATNGNVAAIQIDGLSGAVTVYRP